MGKTILEQLDEEIIVNTRNIIDSVNDRSYWRTVVYASLNLRLP